VLSIVGDLNPDDVEDLTERYFGRMREGEGKIPRLTVDGQKQSRSVDIEVETPGKPQVLVGYQKPVWPDQADVHYTVLQSVLGGGRPSMLYRELVSKKRVAKSVFVSEAPMDRAPSTFVVGASPRPGISNDRLLTEIYSILDRTKTTLFDNQTLDSAKRRVRVKMFKDLKSNAGLAELLGKSELLWGDWRQMTEMYSALSRTSARDLRRIARDDFAIDKRITLRSRPVRGR
jgi:predicted Zn-dependent peptidase